MSNLLKDASILLTPTGYDNGRMNAIKPYKDLYGPELVTNGDFSNGLADWVVDDGTSWTNVNNTAFCDGNNGLIKQNITSAQNKIYKVTFDTIATNSSGKELGVRIDGGTYSWNLYPTGTHTIYLTAGSSNYEGVLFYALGGWTGSIDNVSVVEDLSGDFTFSRGSAATRVNAQGLVENVQIISPELVSNGNFSQEGSEEVLNGNFSQEGSELITNGDFATDSNWNGTNTNGVTISNGSLNYLDTTLNHNVSQGSVVTIGKSYKVTLTVSNYVKGSVLVILGAGGSLQEVSSNGTFTMYGVASINTTFYFQARGASGTTLSIDNISVKEVGQNWDFGGDWTVGENKIIHPAGSSPQYATQDNVLTIGKNYTYSVELLTGNGSNFAQLYVEGVGAIAAFTNGAGVYTGSFTASGTNIQIRAVNADIDVEVTNISIKEVGQDWIFDEWTLYDNAGDLKAKFIGSTSGQYLKQENVYTPNTKIRLQFTISNLTSGQISIISTGVVWSTPTISTNGTFTYDIDTTGTSNGHIYIRAIGGSFNGYIDNISVKEITDDTDIPRINYSGFSYQDSLGSELVTNGDFATDSDWSKDANWTIANGIAASTGTGRMFQSIPFLETNVGTKVKVSFDITDNSNGGVVVNCYGGISQLFTGVGTHTFTTTTTNSSNLYFNNAGAGANFVGSIDNVSVKEYLGQEVVPDSGCGSWLLEPQSTNLVNNSELLNIYFTNKVDTTITDNYGTSPSGETNSSRIQFVDDTSFCYSAISVSTDHTSSVFVKGVSGETVRFGIGSSVVTGDLFTFNGLWQRIDFTASSATQIFFSSYGGATTRDFEAFGLQLEALSYATSYIPTNGATNTRLKDIANNSGNASLINSTEGVLYAEIAALADDGTNRCISLYDGSVNNRLTLVLGVSSNSIRAIIKSNNSTSFDEQHIVASTLDYHKICVKYKENDFALWINGVEVATDTSGVTPIGLDRVTFDTGNDTLNFYGKCKALAVYKEALTDAQLQSLTTI